MILVIFRLEFGLGLGLAVAFGLYFELLAYLITMFGTLGRFGFSELI